mmetsp:Transcript_3284/g.11907  ORF Transcript_3284/g.11907 Transcript_3284/m.11907 type:complete len:318 (-) Transcript_3284:773-1726(-)
MPGGESVEAEAALGATGVAPPSHPSSAMPAGAARPEDIAVKFASDDEEEDIDEDDARARGREADLRHSNSRAREVRGTQQVATATRTSSSPMADFNTDELVTIDDEFVQQQEGRKAPPAVYEFAAWVQRNQVPLPPSLSCLIPADAPLVSPRHRDNEGTVTPPKKQPPSPPPGAHVDHSHALPSYLVHRHTPSWTNRNSMLPKPSAGTGPGLGDLSHRLAAAAVAERAAAPVTATGGEPPSGGLTVLGVQNYNGNMQEKRKHLAGSKQSGKDAFHPHIAYMAQAKVAVASVSSSPSAVDNDENYISARRHHPHTTSL